MKEEVTAKDWALWALTGSPDPQKLAAAQEELCVRIETAIIQFAADKMNIRVMRVHE